MQVSMKPLHLGTQNALSLSVWKSVLYLHQAADACCGHRMMDSLSQDKNLHLPNLRKKQLITKMTLIQFMNVHINQELHYFSHKISPLGSVLGRMNPVHIATSHLSKNYLTSTPPMWKFPKRPLSLSLQSFRQKFSPHFLSLPWVLHTLPISTPHYRS